MGLSGGVGAPVCGGGRVLGGGTGVPANAFSHTLRYSDTLAEMSGSAAKYPAICYLKGRDLHGDYMTGQRACPDRHLTCNCCTWDS